MNENEIMSIMNDINYGWIDKDGNKHKDDYDLFSEYYRLQSPDELSISKLGVCWDQVELERELFKDYDIDTYFIVHYDNDKCPTHTFLTYKKDNKIYWFEHSWEIYRGIHKYDDINELLNDVKQKFIKTELNNSFVKGNLYIYEYNKPKYNISVQEFYNHCEQCKIVYHEE